MLQQNSLNVLRVGPGELTHIDEMYQRRTLALKALLLFWAATVVTSQNPRRIWTSSWCGEPRASVSVFAIVNAEKRKATSTETQPALALNQSLILPLGVAADADTGRVFVSDAAMDFVRAISPTGAAATFAGAPFNPGRTDGPAGVSQVWEPSGLAYETGRQRLIIADYNGCAIRAVNSSSYTSTLLGNVTANGCADDPPVISPDNQVIGPRGVLSIWKPRGLAISESLGILVWTEVAARRIWMVALNMSGTVRLLADPSQTLAVPSTLRQGLQPRGVAIDAVRKCLYVADINSQRIIRLGLPGVGLANPAALDAAIFGGGSAPADGVTAKSAILRGPFGISLSPFGGYIFFSENNYTGSQNDRVRVVLADGTGTIMSVLGRNTTGGVPAFPEPAPYEDQQQTAWIQGPRMLTFEPRSRTLYVADGENYRVLAARCVLPAPRTTSGGCAASGGSMTSIAGMAGLPGSPSDADQASASLLTAPTAVAVERVMPVGQGDVTVRTWIIDSTPCLVSAAIMMLPIPFVCGRISRNACVPRGFEADLPSPQSTLASYNRTFRQRCVSVLRRHCSQLIPSHPVPCPALPHRSPLPSPFSLSLYAAAALRLRRHDLPRRRHRRRLQRRGASRRRRQRAPDAAGHAAGPCD